MIFAIQTMTNRFFQCKFKATGLSIELGISSSKIAFDYIVIFCYNDRHRKWNIPVAPFHQKLHNAIYG